MLECVNGVKYEMIIHPYSCNYASDYKVREKKKKRYMQKIYMSMWDSYPTKTAA